MCDFHWTLTHIYALPHRKPASHSQHRIVSQTTLTIWKAHESLPTLAQTFETSGGLIDMDLFLLDLGELRGKNGLLEQAEIKNEISP